MTQLSSRDVEKLRQQGLIKIDEVPFLIDGMIYAVNPHGERRYLQVAESVLLEANKKLLKG